MSGWALKIELLGLIVAKIALVTVNVIAVVTTISMSEKPPYDRVLSVTAVFSS